MADKVLLIDDSKTQLDVMKLRLCKCGYEVETAENGLDGYNKVFSFIPDIIMSDIMMPELDGYQFCRLLKNNPLTKNIPVILLTVLDKKLDEFWAKKAGAQYFISKTAEFEEIKSTIERLLKDSTLTNSEKEDIQKGRSGQLSVREQVNDILNDLLKQATFLNEFRYLGEFYSQEKILIEKSFDLFSTFIEYDVAGMFFNVPDNEAKKNVYFDVKGKSVSQFVTEKIKREFFSEMNKIELFDVSLSQYELINENSESDDKIVSPNAFKTAYIVPFEFEGKLIGGVAFYSQNEINYRAQKSYDLFKNELFALMKMKYLYSEVEILSVTDGLTGLYNRRHFEYNIEREFLRAKRYKNHLSIAILDIDFFKSVNDDYGHQYGDYVLKEVTKIMKESFRRTDMLYRYGGEEIVIMMPETSLGNAAIPAERLRQKIAEHSFVYNDNKINLTVSIGIATMDDNYTNQKEIVESADRALYRAKQTGRNKVVIFDEQFNDIQ